MKKVKQNVAWEGVVFKVMLAVALVFCALWAKELAYGHDLVGPNGDVVAQTLESHYDYGEAFYGPSDSVDAIAKAALVHESGDTGPAMIPYLPWKSGSEIDPDAIEIEMVAGFGDWELDAGTGPLVISADSGFDPNWFDFGLSYNDFIVGLSESCFEFKVDEKGRLGTLIVTYKGKEIMFPASSLFGRLGFFESEPATNIIVILDRSGSMESMKSDMLGGLNQFISDQKKLEGDAYFTLIQFDTEYEIVYDAVDIQEVDGLELVPRGGTALLDAIGGAFARVYSLPGDGRQTICVIITDGLENSSTVFTKADILSSIEARESWGWKFIYLGANQDAIQEGGGLGITWQNCTTFDVSNVIGTIDTMSTTVSSFRTGGEDE